MFRKFFLRIFNKYEPREVRFIEEIHYNKMPFYGGEFIFHLAFGSRTVIIHSFVFAPAESKGNVFGAAAVSLTVSNSKTSCYLLEHDVSFNRLYLFPIFSFRVCLECIPCPFILWAWEI